MSELGPDARSLLDVARDADGPSLDDAARVRAKLVRRLSVAAAAGTAATVGATGSAAAGAGAAGLGAGMKILAAVALVLGAGTATVALRPAAAPLAVDAPMVISRKTIPEEAIPQIPIIERGHAQAILRDAPRPAWTPIKTEPDRVVSEASLLREAHAAIARGEGDTALDALDRHAARFPRGALVEERQAARVFALCVSGRAAEARVAAAAFVAESPRSPLAPRVQRACAPR